MANVKVNLHYPKNDKYDWDTEMVYIDFDEERRNDIMQGEGFIIKSPKPIKDDLKDPEGIFSTRYGQTLQDLNPFANRYRCECGHMNMRVNNGQICPICHTPVKYVDDDFAYFGWLVLKDDYYVIHSSLYMAIAYFIGSQVLMNMLKINKKIDEDGRIIEKIKAPKDEPYFGIGMMEFHDRFDEIMNYYKEKVKSPAKLEFYDDIMRNREKVFTHSIPVYTTLLRPYRLEGGDLHFESTNSDYKIMASLVASINNDKLKINKKAKMKNELLYDLQMKIKSLFDEINKILSGKKGSIRGLVAGRMNFTARSVIVPNNNNKIDEITLSYQCLCGLYQQVIINILQRSYNMSYNDAYEYLDERRKEEDPVILSILEGMIADRKSRGKRGLPMLINRNPTISFGGIVQVYCTNITDSYTMGINLGIIKGLAADFDGDTLNILAIINDEFERYCAICFNPRNAFYISNNDGMMNSDVNHQRDIIINSNTLMQLSRENYSADDIAYIHKLQAMPD